MEQNHQDAQSISMLEFDQKKKQPKITKKFYKMRKRHGKGQ